MAGSFLSCAACLRRIAQVAVPRLALVPAGAIPARNAISTGRQRRQYSTTGVTERAALVEEEHAPRTLDEPVATKLNKDGSRILDEAGQARLNQIVTKDLDHLRDPYPIAQRVAQLLKRGNYDHALLLTRRASVNHKVTVSWNSLIDFLLQEQRLKSAIKLLNDMKKRGQLPNVQTYTILFRGLAKSHHPKLAVSEAVKYYHVLLNDSRLEPNSIHLNAVLNVCAKAGDLDSLFVIAETINDSVRAPDAFTYTIILNALRHAVTVETKDLTDEQRDSHIRKTIDRAKGLWSEIISKWTAGRLIVDEQLVCSMGRVLLASPKREDKGETLDLLQQAMAIPNLTKTLELDPFQDTSLRDIAASKVPKVAKSSRALYAVPGPNTLSLVLATLKLTKQSTVGIKYWNLLVRHCGIVPDKDNWLRLFQLLRGAKASAHAAATLDLVPDEHLDPRAYLYAMQTCVLDNINKNSLEHSITVLQSMLARLPVPDLHALRLHLRVALVCHSHLRTKAESGSADDARREYGTQIAEALERLWTPYKNAHRYYFETREDGPGRPKTTAAKAALYNEKREVVALARHMFSAFNKVLNEGMLPEQDLVKFRKMGARINREIQTFYSDREAREPKLNPSDDLVKDDANGEIDPDNNPRSGFRVGGDFIWNTRRAFEPKSTRETAFSRSREPGRNHENGRIRERRFGY